jgi:hypothetical protein
MRAHAIAERAYDRPIGTVLTFIAGAVVVLVLIAIVIGWKDGSAYPFDAYRRGLDRLRRSLWHRGPDD